MLMEVYNYKRDIKACDGQLKLQRFDREDNSCN